MNKIRFFIALWLSKISIIALKLTRHRGTNFPGELALRICPDFLKYISKPNKVIAVTGTNGKTTVNNLINDILEKDGKKVLSNRFGSNINSGISTSLIYGTNIFNKCSYDLAAFEIDERSAVRVYPHLKPNYLLITNLSRDSIMRNAHPEYISNLLTKYIPKETKLILNADDLISSRVSPDNDRVYFGIDKMSTDLKERINIVSDLQICPKCHSKLKYEYLRYHHIGKAYCPNCNFKAPDYDYEGKVDLENMTIEVLNKKEKETYKLINNGIHNIYNQLSAIATLKELGYSFQQLKELFSKVEIVKSRLNEEKVKNQRVIMLLSKEKNALGVTRSLDYATSYEGKKQFLLMMNCLHDEIEWSENTCWLYDCDFEFLNKKDIINIVATGPRYKDYKLRLLLAGVPKEKIKEARSELEATKLLNFEEESIIFILYGTDSIDLAEKVRKKVINEIIEGGSNNEN